MHVCKQLGMKILYQIPHEEGIFSKPVWTREMITLKVNWLFQNRQKMKHLNYLTFEWKDQAEQCAASIA